MRKLVLFILFLLIYCSIQAQCPNGNINLRTQLEVDNFAADYPACTEIIGELRIGVWSGTSDITDLSNLPPIESIGRLEIWRNYDLTDLSGLENLTSVDDLSISRNNALTDLSGLENLTSIGGLFIERNEALTALSAFENLTSVDDLSISRNALTDLSGLENLTSVGGNLWIRENAGLTSLSGLENLTSVDVLDIWANYGLTDLSGLDNLTSVGGSLSIRQNGGLTSLSGLENLTSIDFLFVSRNYYLTDLSGLENLTSTRSMLISGNDALTALSGLENLTSISSLDIENNDALTDLSSLENLDSIEYLRISGNDVLTDLSVLENFISIHILSISGNAALTDLSSVGNVTSIHSLGISGNAALTDLSSLGNLTSIHDLIIGNNDGLTDLSGLELTSIDGELRISGNDGLTDLSGLENFTSIDSLVIWGNNALINLNGLENLTSVGGELTIKFNDALTDLSGLENLTSISGDLLIDDNTALIDFSGLENLTSIGNDLIIEDNAALSDFSDLENLTSIGDDLGIRYNAALTDLSGLESLTSIGGSLNIWINTALTDLSGLESLTSIGGDLRIENNDALINLNGLENLTSTGGSLRITFNNNLTDLNALENLTSTGGDLRIHDNPTLSICQVPFICDYLFNGGVSTISGNASGCNSTVEILNTCPSFARVHTDVFYDLNQNATKEANEPNYYDASISIMPGDNSFYAQNTGIIFIDPGTYTATFDTINNPNWQLTTATTSYDLDLASGDTETITFGVYPIQQISHIQTIINSPPARCNEIITLDLSTKNLGTTIASGTMWLTIDDAISEFSFIHQPDTIVESNDTYYGWYYTDLYPGQSIIKNVAITVPGPPDFDLGERLLFGSFSQYTDANGDDTSEGFRYDPEVRCSYDPNDKLVNPKREGDYVLFEEDFIYTIRFQNTGNDVAYDVVIRDTLDANLDRSTFRVLGSSHADKLNTILNEDEGILTFEFRDIFLPDSTSNFEASQGYVNYLISPFDGLAEETPITNSAGIYFDLNPPVITNTVQSVMVSELPTVSTETPDNSFDFNILPNPNTGIFQVNGIPKGTYQIHNTSGQIIQEGNMQNDLLIDISQQAKGVYFISVTIDKETFVKRMIKM